MNVPLVESLVQVILALPPEERTLLEERLHRQTNWQATLERERIDEHRAAAHTERGGKPLDLPVDEIIHQMRAERTEELMRACFSEPEAE